jgi:hypothetical protein
MSSFQKRIGLSVVLFGVAIVALAIGMSLTNQPAPPVQDIPPLAMTFDPTLIANLTSIPQATPLSDEDAEQFLIFVNRIETCEDYSGERRAQMLQHIEWLVDPASIPTNMLLAFGKTPDSTLIFGMASYTSIQWKLLERPADSCLVDIGRDLNLLLEGVGREPLTIYDESQ